MGAPGALSISAGMYNRPALTSPMAQLTCLLPSQSKEAKQTSPDEQKTPTTPPSSKNSFVIERKLVELLFYLQQNPLH